MNYDKDFAGIVFWLAVTEQRAHVSLEGEVVVLPLQEHVRKRKRHRREAAARLAAAEVKRQRKAARRMK